MSKHDKIAMNAQYLFLGIIEWCQGWFGDDEMCFEGRLCCVLYFIYHLYINSMNVSQSRRREESAIKKLQNSKEIDTLYHEFQSLKSQIYGVKRQTKSKPIDTQWSNKNNKDKAIGMLRESTIHKCQQQFQQNLTILQMSQLKTGKNLFKNNTHNHSESDDFVAELREGKVNNKNFSKKLKEYSQEVSINIEESLGQSLKMQNLHFAQGQQMFRQFLSNNAANSANSALSVSRREHNVQNMVQIQSLFNQITEDHLKKLNFLLQTLTFMSRKLHCLQLIILQYGKVLKAKSEHNLNENTQQNQLLLDIQAIQRKYESEMKKLAQFYQLQLKKQTSKFVQSRIKASFSLAKNDDKQSEIQQLREDNSRLTQLLKQAKDLISTKQQFISSLSEENQDLKEQVQKWKRANHIRGSADSSLGYSVTADRHPKKQSSHEMGHIAERLNLAVSNEKRDWDQFQQNSNDDINYSELQSVKDRQERQIQDWDISHLEMRQNSNAKSLQQDCLKIMGNRRHRREDEAF